VIAKSRTAVFAANRLEVNSSTKASRRKSNWRPDFLAGTLGAPPQNGMLCQKNTKPILPDAAPRRVDAMREAAELVETREALFPQVQVPM
jgi:hypothetical protein